MTDDIHSCSYYCDRPACIKAQRDELVRKYVEAQAEWPSDAVDKVWAKLVSPATPSAVKRTSITKEYMRAALQSVRPPVGLVSDEDVEHCANERMDNGEPVHQWLIFGSEGPEPLIRTILESYASRHAPTKD